VRTHLRRKPENAARKERIPVRVRSVIASLVPEFLKARREETRTILMALEKGDLDMIRVLGHSMKGVGSAYGFPPITQIGRGLEDAAKAGEKDEIRKRVDDLVDYLDRVDVLPE
jgi:HPt (histidine-containing phosphotransfer) domain-containing protein